MLLLFWSLKLSKTSFHGTKQTCLRLQLSEENKGLFSEIYACFYVAILSIGQWKSGWMGIQIPTKRGDDHSLPYSTNPMGADRLIDQKTLILLFEHQVAPSRAIFVAGVQRTTAATSHCPARNARSHQRFRPRWKKGRWWLPGCRHGGL